MFTDEREETLREVAALGNFKAVHHFIHSGVNINSQNKINGWTALHWAAHRGHENIVRLLLSNGASTCVTTKKLQTAYDLAQRHLSVAALLAVDGQHKVEVGPEPELPIVPVYMQNPDLQKTWLHPEEFAENKLENMVRQQAAVVAMTSSEPPHPPQATATHASFVAMDTSSSDTRQEIFVYLSTRSNETLLGSVYVENDTLAAVVEQMKEELDGLPAEFSIARHNGMMSIPISSKQMNKRLLDMFRSKQDIVVVIPAA
ncbi:hypothetical protein BDF14DRAFT_1855201 [Spinellus fusiger]|nr:hypothetical protein BDF14DRAFT_1855201 [Spinellus fusiger]